MPVLAGRLVETFIEDTVLYFAALEHSWVKIAKTRPKISFVEVHVQFFSKSALRFILSNPQLIVLTAKKFLYFQKTPVF